MPIVVDVKDAQPRRTAIEVDDYTRTTREEDRYYATHYMGAPPDTAPDTMKSAADDKSLPQAYLVEQPPHATVPAHFHDTNQFQVFVKGATGFDKANVAALSLHYAGGHTPYGPIVTEDQGVHFFTLRQQWDSGGKPMPEMRDRLKPVRRCFRMAEDVLAAALPGGCSDVLPCEDDGLGAALYTLAADQQETLDLSRAGGGQYVLITAGSVHHDGAELAANSCVFRFPEEPPLTVTAGDMGASVLVLQFPVLADT